jgi:hypothetical protein
MLGRDPTVADRTSNSPQDEFARVRSPAEPRDRGSGSPRWRYRLGDLFWSMCVVGLLLASARAYFVGTGGNSERLEDVGLMLWLASMLPAIWLLPRVLMAARAFADAERRARVYLCCVILAAPVALCALICAWISITSANSTTNLDAPETRMAALEFQRSPPAAFKILETSIVFLLAMQPVLLVGLLLVTLPWMGTMRRDVLTLQLSIGVSLLMPSGAGILFLLMLW